MLNPRPGAEPAAAPPERPPLSRNIRWAFIGTVAYSVSNWLLVIILARLIGPAAVGSYAFALALSAPVTAFGGLPMRSLLAADATGRFVFREYLQLTGLATAAALLVTAALAAIGGSGGTSLMVIVMVLVMRAADAFAETYFGLWQRQERMRILGVGRIVQAVLANGLVFALTYAGGGVSGAAAGATIGSLALVAYLHVSTAADRHARQELRRRHPEASWARLGRLAALALPLGIIQILSAFHTTVPRWFIDRSSGAATLGLFASAAQLTTAGNTAVGAVGSAVLPRLASHWNQNRRAFMSLARKMILAGIVLGVLGVATSALIGRQVLTIVYRPEFAEAEQMLIVLSIAAGVSFVAQFLGWILTAADVIRVQPVLLIASLITLIAGCAVLVPMLDGSGAAWAMALGFVVQAAASYVALRRAHPARGHPEERA